MRQPAVAGLAPARESAREVRDDVVAGLTNSRSRTLYDDVSGVATVGVIGPLNTHPGVYLEFISGAHYFAEVKIRTTASHDICAPTGIFREGGGRKQPGLKTPPDFWRTKGAKEQWCYFFYILDLRAF